LAGDQDYIVTVTNALGCSSQLRVNLLDGPLLVLNEFPEDTFICEGDAFLLDLRAYTNQLVEGQDGFSSEEALVSLADAGEYRISVTNDGGCMATTSLFLTVTDSSFEAGLSLASDAVISLPFFALDQSTPEPDSVVWLYNEAVATLEGREERTYFFDFNTPGDYTLGLVAFLQGCVDTTFANFTMHADSSTITSINGAPAASINLQVVPNPSGGVFKLTADFPKVTEATVLVYGPTGQLVLIRELPRVAALNERFDLVLPVGVYFLQLLTAEAQWIVPVVIR
jgi:hypothetical protein